MHDDSYFRANSGTHTHQYRSHDIRWVKKEALEWMRKNPPAGERPYDNDAIVAEMVIAGTLGADRKEWRPGPDGKWLLVTDTRGEDDSAALRRALSKNRKAIRDARKKGRKKGRKKVSKNAAKKGGQAFLPGMSASAERHARLLEVEKLLGKAEPFRQYGPDYDRGIDETAHDLEHARLLWREGMSEPSSVGWFSKSLQSHIKRREEELEKRLEKKNVEAVTSFYKQQQEGFAEGQKKEAERRRQRQYWESVAGQETYRRADAMIRKEAAPHRKKGSQDYDPAIASEATKLETLLRNARTQGLLSEAELTAAMNRLRLNLDRWVRDVVARVERAAKEKKEKDAQAFQASALGTFKAGKKRKEVKKELKDYAASLVVRKGKGYWAVERVGLPSHRSPHVMKYPSKKQATRHVQIVRGDLSVAPAWYRDLLAEAKRKGMTPSERLRYAAGHAQSLGLGPDHVLADPKTFEPKPLPQDTPRAERRRRPRTKASKKLQSQAFQASALGTFKADKQKKMSAAAAPTAEDFSAAKAFLRKVKQAGTPWTADLERRLRDAFPSLTASALRSLKASVYSKPPAAPPPKKVPKTAATDGYQIQRRREDYPNLVWVVCEDCGRERMINLEESMPTVAEVPHARRCERRFNPPPNLAGLLATSKPAGKRGAPKKRTTKKSAKKAPKKKSPGRKPPKPPRCDNSPCKYVGGYWRRSKD